MTNPQLQATPDDTSDADLLIEDQRFSIVPEWVIDADIPDSSFRLYSLLLRYGNGTGNRMPSRATLARRLRRSVDAVDRALRSLSEAGVVRVEHRRAGKQHLPNRYHVRTSDPANPAHGRSGRTSAATDAVTPIPGRTGAATPGRSSAARVAADVRHDREVLTDRTPPPPSSPESTDHPVEGCEALLSACGIDDLPGLADQLSAVRRSLGKSSGRWSGPCLVAAIQLAVTLRGWPAARVVEALAAVAADPESRSPARLAEAGPWWDEPAGPELDPDTLAALEWRLAETGGVRPLVQRLARAELDAEGLPRTRGAVAQRACLILDRRAAETTTTDQPDPDVATPAGAEPEPVLTEGARS